MKLRHSWSWRRPLGHGTVAWRHFDVARHLCARPAQLIAYLHRIGL